MTSKISIFITVIVFLSPIVSESEVDPDLSGRLRQITPTFCDHKPASYVIPSYLKQKEAAEKCLKKHSIPEKCSQIKFIGSDPIGIGSQDNCEKNAKIFLKLLMCYNDAIREHPKVGKLCGHIDLIAQTPEAQKQILDQRNPLKSK